MERTDETVAREAAAMCAVFSRLSALRSIRLPTSPFGLFYHRLVDRGLKKGMAVTAVMRKLLIVADHLIQTQEDYDASKVGVQALRA